MLHNLLIVLHISLELGRYPAARSGLRVVQRLGSVGGFDESVPGNVTRTAPPGDRTTWSESVLRVELLSQGGAPIYHTCVFLSNHHTRTHAMKSQGKLLPSAPPLLSPFWFSRAPHQHLVLQGVFVSRAPARGEQTPNSSATRPQRDPSCGGLTKTHMSGK